MTSGGPSESTNLLIFKLYRDAFRSNELATAEEQRSWSRGFAAKLRREIETLEAMPADVSDEEVRRAMGVAS